MWWDRVYEPIKSSGIKVLHNATRLNANRKRERKKSYEVHLKDRDDRRGWSVSLSPCVDVSAAVSTLVKSLFLHPLPKNPYVSPIYCVCVSVCMSVCLCIFMHVFLLTAIYFSVQAVFFQHCLYVCVSYVCLCAQSKLVCAYVHIQVCLYPASVSAHLYFSLFIMCDGDLVRDSQGLCVFVSFCQQSCFWGDEKKKKKMRKFQ